MEQKMKAGPDRKRQSGMAGSLRGYPVTLDYSLRLPCAPPFGHSMRYALLSRLRWNDGKEVIKPVFNIRMSFPHKRESSSSVDSISAINPAHLSFPRRRESSAVLDLSPGSYCFSSVIPMQAGIQ
jgi:hypothetical protein